MKFWYWEDRNKRDMLSEKQRKRGEGRGVRSLGWVRGGGGGLVCCGMFNGLLPTFSLVPWTINKQITLLGFQSIFTRAMLTENKQNS